MNWRKINLFDYTEPRISLIDDQFSISHSFVHVISNFFFFFSAGRTTQEIVMAMNIPLFSLADTLQMIPYFLFIIFKKKITKKKKKKKEKK
jgi:mannose/fructose/N-acetylgalactosamine-specific phosphotransferase system component IIC